MTAAPDTESPGTETLDPRPLDAERWDALRRRDPTADGRFVYAVRSTGVYCRPSCAARPARRENVVFFASNAEAEQAGFRPCKRCRPDGASQAERWAELVARACRLIDEAEEAPALGGLAEAVGMSPHHFHRVFKQLTGVTPRAYGAACRAARVAGSLPTSASVTEAIYEAGYASSGRFYEAAGARLGMTPTAFRRGGQGETIRFAVGACSLGAILVAATGRGVCAITLGEDPDALVRDLQERFPKAELIGGDAAFEAMVAQVVGFVEAPGTGLDLPLDIGGTAFQQRVWQALRAVPPGRTVTYTDIARAIGAPAAVRAVGAACGANPIAVAIPCHRVVRTDGALAGYRWGVERKRALLRRESEEASR
ncbi:bifunctional DNA-binding transcriptional regulator/O6-methylguanine-DNA methyltransferase Ada [Azospirillum picis]|uniref:AraC family transcriptional regulator of adaptative response/methylated-DNA-[protein]-cysteine methyltransferase n=1 Tax=Azospirillum picis TaxID=488438 RepID=A0ABU0MHR9_9PROT|nr:bifunctional DNA-binding transcriptional regulator/O6-methylguanine-DNA methyltransferase Ada [Azospirillum picis]MBP2299002.1 AraC family transcriptional regulator of adaptative response/methylated-DNA-[protein]-cysteine methyltransferase [Azospirillum picis]MDQ0532756.1 AraC family transcriptional regulator of adaptative response/methylated-DNA-[protein]-cysteine methyltransferase [Azospirillum picis]